MVNEVMAVIFELKAEYGFASEDAEIHLWHLVREGSSLALCDRAMTAESRTRSALALRDVFPERLCQECRRRYCELLPSTPPTAAGTSTAPAAVEPIQTVQTVRAVRGIG
ncbi:hypothetical protein ABH931_001922 [Streptacidiphilus sp. MAP12-33]|uniref:hypothetical protein n=1 Tax=Streptacidiphilus sp. MAP12-33 TaxID=3156266 RepID=UPI003515DFD8